MPSKAKVLIVDDDAKLLRELRSGLEKIGYDVTGASEAKAALTLADSIENLSIIVLDITFTNTKLSKEFAIDGIEALRRLREKTDVPILMLSQTAISTVKTMTLKLGADDYISKPFDFHELAARMEAILRRSNSERVGEQVLTFHRLKLDPGERRVWKDGALVDLTGVEFDLLYVLARRPDHVFTRDKLLELAWKDGRFTVPKVVDVHIGHIRKKLEEDPVAPAFIKTVRGTGYRFEDALT